MIGRPLARPSTFRPRLGAVAVEAALLLTLATSGWAATYCVDLSGGTCDFTSSGAAGLQSALTAAAASGANDTIRIGPGTYLGPFTYTPAGDAGTLTVIGSGSDQTTLSVPSPGSMVTAVLVLARDAAGHPANVSQVAVIIPATAYTGIRTDGLVEDARITSTPGTGGPLGVYLLGTGCGVRRCQIDMNNVSQAIGVEVDAGTTFSPDPSPAFIEDSSVLNGLVTIEAFAPLHVTRCRVSGKGNSAIIARGTQVVIDDSLVLAESASALRAGSESGPRAGSILVRQVTAVSVGPTPAFAGIDVDAFEDNATADVRHSIIRGFQYSTFRRAAVNVAATVTISASNYPFGVHLVQGAGTTTLSEPQPNIDADPLFTDPLTGDYSLRDGSPAIDAAYSPPLASDESPTDLLGASRIQDGNGDGTAARDMGAFEHAALACVTPRCLFDVALHGSACAGSTVPRKILMKIDRVVTLYDSIGTIGGKQRRRLVARVRRTLGAIGRAAGHASKGRAPRIPTGCAAAIRDAANAVGGQLTP